MVQNGFESRVKVQQIIDSQLPEFILDESPKAVDFLRQYYISQEYQGGSTDIGENLDQYLKLDNLTPEVIVGSTVLSETINSQSSTIVVESTKGFPNTYGLIKIGDEIITYTGSTSTTFTGCIRGFSGITNYHKELNYEELVFNQSSAESHASGAIVENLSSLFLNEFYKKLKYTLTPGLENTDFVSDLNVGNFIKEARTLYQSKGTEESFRILFNVLFGETPKIIDLEKYLIKPSSASYIRREVVVAERISGDPLLLSGQTIKKTTDDNTSASVSEVEIIRRKGKTYYKLLLFVGYDDSFPTITGTFGITGSTKIIGNVSTGSDVITVDSTIGFPESGTLYSGNNEITYTSKSIDQFFGCSGISEQINSTDTIRSDETYYGYENGELTKKVELRLTGVLSDFRTIIQGSSVDVGEQIGIKNLGESIENPPEDKSYKQVFANSWIYNTSSRYQISSFTSGLISQVTLGKEIDKSSLKVGDIIDVLYRDSEVVVESNLTVTQINAQQVSTNGSFSLSSSFDYDIRRKLNYASSSIVPLEFENLKSDIQNVYNDSDEYMYVASNSLPSYEIQKGIFTYLASGISGLDTDTGLYSIINFIDKVSFFTGSEIYYTPSGTPIVGLSEGIYYVEVINDRRQIRLYNSRSFIGTESYIKFESFASGTHRFTLNSQKENIISPQKILRKFPLSVNIADGESEQTPVGSVGMLINGVEISGYKTNERVYYGPLQEVNVLNGGDGYDVINPPLITPSSGSAKLQSVVSGSVKKIYVDPQEFDVDVLVSVALTGGNGKGATFEPVIETRRREVKFDAREIGFGGGLDITTETITFEVPHNLIDGQSIVYDSVNNSPIGIGSFGGSNANTSLVLKTGATYYTKYISDTTIQIYQKLSDYRSGINTVGFTSIGNSGTHIFRTEPKKTLREIKVINSGSGYTNRKLRVTPVGISTVNDTITSTNHGFSDGELVTYTYESSPIVGLSTSNQYYIIKIDSNTFRLANAGIGGTFSNNYLRGKYVDFSSTGAGYQIFNYPEISLNVTYSASGIGSTQVIGSVVATPVITGQIVGIYVYEQGSDYGSANINLHKKPQILIKNGKNAQLKSVIINGQIKDINIQYGGSEYYSTPEIKVIGSGTGASIKAVVSNNKIVDAVIVNPGSGYDQETTTLVVESAGKNSILDPQIRSVTINKNSFYGIEGDTRTESNELITSSYNKLQYTISGYSENIQTQFEDFGIEHSPIIGWAYDGNPIYGSYGYSNAKDRNSIIKRLVSGYNKNITNINNRPSGFGLGFFIEDYVFDNNGDLDQYNGRYCVTPEFPNGVYAYFATSIEDSFGNLVGEFPYFIGERYRSRFIGENTSLDQSFDFNTSNLTRNTLPYNVNQQFAGNDFIIESNEIINQLTLVESVTTGTVNDFDIIDSGDGYKIGDTLLFNQNNTGGSGLSTKVSEIKGKIIDNIQTSVQSYDDAIFTWKNNNQIEVKVTPKHNLDNLNYVNVSGFTSTIASLNGSQQIGVTSFSSSLIKDIPPYSLVGVVTDIYISNIPENISIGSSIGIGTETLSVLNVFGAQNVIRVLRETTGTAHTATTPVYFAPDTFTINKSVDYFESKINDLVYFNPKQSVGVGTTSGIGIAVTNNVGVQTNNIISIPTQSIYLPNHPFRTNQAVTFTKPGTASSISVANTEGSTAFNLPLSGNSQTVYIIKKSVDHIGIVTQIGLTTTKNGLFFINNGSDNYQYSLQSNFTQVKGDIENIVTQVSVSTSHSLTSGDTIKLLVEPNLSVGIGTSTSVRVKRNTILDSLVINTIEVSSSGINTVTQEITIPSHEFKTGDKVVYVRGSNTGEETSTVYYVYKIDNNNIQLCETLVDAFSVPPVVVNISSIASIITFGSLGSGPKWSGGVLAPNGKIYGIPSSASQVLVIDPVGLTTSTFGSLGSDVNKWQGGVLAPNGKIYGIPFGASSVLEIDPVGLTTSSFGSLGNSGGKWAEGVLAPNGKIYGIPFGASSVLEIDPVGLTTSTFGSLGSGPKWSGGVLAPNGKIYGIPYNASSVLEIDPVGLTTSSFGSLGNSNAKWYGGVLAPNGKIYGIPYTDPKVLVIDPVGLTTSTFGSLESSIKWSGGVLAPNGKIYGIPFGASSVLEIDPVGLTTSSFGSLSGSLKWFGGVLAPNGKIYGIPSNASNVLVIDPLGDAKEIQNINPTIPSIKNNNLVFDLSDSSLSGYNFKIFYDQDFKDEFISTGSTSTFSVSGVGTVGLSTNASLTINYSEGLPSQLFYALEKTGYISTADKEVQNYSKINFVDSKYNGSYSITSVGNTTFNISLQYIPENLNYNSSECDLLEYSTNSTTANGGISKIRIISEGVGFKKLPIFTGAESSNGSGAYIIAKSSDIGKIRGTKILNEGFEYSSDKTLRPTADIPTLVTIKDANIISEVKVLDGGKNYSSSPNLIIVDSNTKNIIDSGHLSANITGTSIGSVDVVESPKGIPPSIEIKSINNSNGVGIQTIATSSSGIVTCFLVTPLNGFDIEPFVVGDKIYIEGIQKYGDSGDGFNSENYEYRFFDVTNYVNGGTILQRKLEYNLSGISTNVGIAKTIQESYGSIVNSKNYPIFEVTQTYSPFIDGEVLSVEGTTQDLKVSSDNENYIKVSGSYEVSSGQVLRGTQSGNLATINSVERTTGQFNISYGSKQNIGWSNDTGKLDVDSQVIPDNDYYQNLSYSVRSNQTWEDIVTPVNSILHPSGLKNFSDTTITNNVGVGNTIVEDLSNILYDVIGQQRVDTINNFDLVIDVDTLENSSNFLKFSNKKLTDYIEVRTNRVLEIDDISGQFSSSDFGTDDIVNLISISPEDKYNRYLLQITSEDNSELQFTEIVVINSDTDVYTLEKSTITNLDSPIAEISGYYNELGDLSLRMVPEKTDNTDYKIKILNDNFSSFFAGIGTISIGFVDLIGSNVVVNSGITTSLISKNTINIESLYSHIHVLNTTTNEMNYVEIYVDHNGTDTNISEFYFDSDPDLSGNFIGSFGASISGGILSLNYINTSSNNIILRSKTIGFNTTAAGIGTFRFKTPGQLNGFERTVNYTADYSNISTASTIVSLNIPEFTSVKSTVKVSIGNTSALHQVMMINDGTNSYTVQYPFLSIGSTSGIGTFGSEISGLKANLKFYPDPEYSGTMEVLSFNEKFYRDLDIVNIPQDLEYASIVESVKTSRFYSANSRSRNIYSFDATYQGTQIFAKTFNPSDSDVLNLVSGEFSIANHFFNTGEELIYRPESTFLGIGSLPLGIGQTLNNVGVVTDKLPSTVYAYKINNDKFKLSTRKDYALSGICVTFTSVGEGNAHQLEMTNKNSKSIISIDNIVQYPIAYSLLTYTVNNGASIGVNTSIFALSGISSIFPEDILKIDDEFMKVNNVGFGTTNAGPITFSGSLPLVEVERGFVGTASSIHSNLSTVNLYRGSFNIVGNQIHFTNPPKGSLEDQMGTNLDNLPESRSLFNGRVFLRSNYDNNQVYDNISERFTGIEQTYPLTVQGISTTGLGSTGGNGIVLINGIFQTPTTENNSNNNYSITENVGVSSVIFSGITSSNGSIVISQSDVNMNQLPRGGIIVSLGSSSGLGYAPLVGASATANVSGGSIISIGIGTTGNYGSGYRSPVSIAVTESGHTGAAATITATVGAGGTLSFNIVGGGTGYVNPTINISSPSYQNLPVIGVSRLGVGATTSTGVGLLLNVEVGASSTVGVGSTLFEVTKFNISRTGYGFKKGDVIKPVGLVTAYGLASPVSEFQLTVLDTFTDSFGAWQFGQLDYIDSIKNYQDGFRTRFPLYYNAQLISFEKNSSNQDSQVIDFDSLLLIFINGILQQPKVSYQFSGGTSFIFSNPPKPEDNIAIFFYRGSSSDSTIVNVNETLKSGDQLQVYSNNNYLESTTTQDSRTILSISSSDKVQTNLYSLQGIDIVNKKPVSWTKQKVDMVLDGTIISKSRDSLESQIYPTAKVIKNFSSIDTDIYVDNAQFFNYEGESAGNIDFDALIVSGSSDPVSAAITATVSVGGTIQSLTINNAGSGYIGAAVTVSISAPPSIGVGIGTTATATISIVNGSLSTVTITNPGFGYVRSSPPQVIAPLPDPIYENISGITVISGLSGNITGIGTTVGIGTDLAIKFTLSSVSQLSVGYPIYIFDTKVGNGVTSIYSTNSATIGIGTTFLDNIYNISGIDAGSGIVTCNIHSNSSIVGIATTGSSVGKFSWGKLSGFTRSTSPISIAVSSYNVDSGLSTFPTIQRRGYGLRDIGSIKKNL